MTSKKLTMIFSLTVILALITGLTCENSIEESNPLEITYLKEVSPSNLSAFSLENHIESNPSINEKHQVSKIKGPPQANQISIGILEKQEKENSVMEEVREDNSITKTIGKSLQNFINWLNKEGGNTNERKDDSRQIEFNFDDFEGQASHGKGKKHKKHHSDKNKSDKEENKHHKKQHKNKKDKKSKGEDFKMNEEEKTLIKEEMMKEVDEFRKVKQSDYDRKYMEDIDQPKFLWELDGKANENNHKNFPPNHLKKEMFGNNNKEEFEKERREENKWKHHKKANGEEPEKIIEANELDIFSTKEIENHKEIKHSFYKDNKNDHIELNNENPDRNLLHIHTPNEMSERFSSDRSSYIYDFSSNINAYSQEKSYEPKKDWDLPNDGRVRKREYNYDLISDNDFNEHYRQKNHHSKDRNNEFHRNRYCHKGIDFDGFCFKPSHSRIFNIILLILIILTFLCFIGVVGCGIYRCCKRIKISITYLPETPSRFEWNCRRERIHEEGEVERIEREVPEQRKEENKEIKESKKVKEQKEESKCSKKNNHLKTNDGNFGPYPDLEDIKSQPYTETLLGKEDFNATKEQKVYYYNINRKSDPSD